MTQVPARKNVLITGGTGFLGKAVLARLTEVPEYDRIYLLVRSKRNETAAERVAKIIERMFAPGKVAQIRERIVALEGDLVTDKLGLTDATVESLKPAIHQILHVGASTDFGAPIEESRLNNVVGTENVLKLALRLKEGGVFERFDYVSTAYVAGLKKGAVGEDDLERDQSFANNYERSKFEAEVMVRQYKKRLKIAIYRPSIVVGDSKSGFTPHFKVLYWPLMLLSKGIMPFFPCNGRAHLDVVPVDYVADGIVALMQEAASLGNTYYLTAGIGNEICIRDFLRDAYNIAEIRKVPVVPFWLFNFIKNTPISRKFPETFWDAVDLAAPYEFYLRGTSVRFDATRSKEVLASLGVSAPNWDNYKREVLTFCRASRWGKKLPMPEYIYYLPVSTRKEIWNEFTHRQGKGRAVPAPV